MGRERKKVKGNTSIFIKIRTILSQSCDKNYSLLTNENATLIFFFLPVHFSSFLKKKKPNHSASPEGRAVMRAAGKVEGVNPCASQLGRNLPAAFGEDPGAAGAATVPGECLLRSSSSGHDSPSSLQGLARASRRVAWSCKQAELCIPSQRG